MMTNRRRFLAALCCLPVVARPKDRYAAWSRVLAKAEGALYRYKMTGKQAQAQLQRMAKSFGVDSSRQADVTVKAVSRIGGSHPLTESEQRIVFDEIHYHQSRSLVDAILVNPGSGPIR